MSGLADPARALARARELIAAGQVEEASALLEGLVRDGRASIDVRLSLAHALQLVARFDDERGVLESAIAAFPAEVEAHAALARLRWMTGAGAAFADPMRAAVKAQPANLALRLKCADMLRLAGLPEPAEALLREALVPGQSYVLAWLSVLLDEMGRLDEALVMHAQVVRDYPREWNPRLNRAHTLMRLGRSQEALTDLAQVRAARPLDQMALAYETMALRQLGDPRYRWLCNYERDVRIYDLAPPPGYADIAAFNRALAASLRGRQKLAAHPLDQTLRGGSQTSQDLRFSDDPVIRAYLAALDGPIGAYITAMDPDPRHPLGSRRSSGHKLAGCWSVLLRPHGFHVNHVHSEGWISSAYYVSLPAGMGGAGQEGWIKFGEPRWPIPGCDVERLVEPKEGRLVLFPSYMWHGTVPFVSGERLTAPFDVVPGPGGR